MSAEIGLINYLVIGVGVNVNQESFSEEIQEKATSLRLELGRHIRRSEVIAAVMEEFEACYETFLKTGDLAGVKEKYNRMLVNRGREVKILEPGNEYEAHALGINNDGELIVRTKDGQEHGKVVLCGANSYEEKYYLNPDFEQLPGSVKDELKIMCVLYVNDVGGILTLVYHENGELCFEVTSEEFDPMFDEIGSRLKIKQLQREKQDLLEALQMYYKVFFLEN